jgi:4-hydroxyphenylpyruvate dioxygenase
VELVVLQQFLQYLTKAKQGRYSVSLTNQKRQLQQTSVRSQLQGIDYVELYVSNARQAAHYYQTAFGFVPIARAGLETGVRDRASVVLRQGECHLILTAPLSSNGPISHFIQVHGDSVSDIAFRVEDASQAFTEAVRGGADPILEPTEVRDAEGSVVKATVAVYGDIVHSFIQRNDFA